MKLYLSLNANLMKLKVPILLSFGILFLVGSISCARQYASCPPISIPSGIPENQYVRIDFERFDKTKGIVWLRLTNYTAWPIRIPVELFPFPSGNISLEVVKQARSHPNGAEVNVRYYLDEYDPGPWTQVVYSDGRKDPPDEPEHPPIPLIHRFDIVGEWWIPVKESIIFQVSKEHLARNIALYVDIRYEWEAHPVEVLDGPVHRVFFRGIELPKDVQAEIK